MTERLSPLLSHDRKGVVLLVFRSTKKHHSRAVVAQYRRRLLVR